MADSIKNLLEGLGSTADEVALFLEGQGCQGEPRQSGGCPVQKYLARATGRADLLVGKMAVSRTPAEDEPFTATMEARHIEWLSRPVMDFVGRFDDGLYPELVKRG